MRPTLLSLATTCAVGFALFTAPAVAQNAKIIQTVIIGEDSVQQRINLSGKLRMLSQLIPSAACHLVQGFDKDASQKLLQGATAEFEKILNGLEFGDTDLDIELAEERRLTIAEINRVRENWEPIQAAANAMVAGDVSDRNSQVLMDNNMTLLESATNLATEISAQYSNPNELVQADAMLIDISGRQSMLTQKMSKEACMMALGEETVGELQGTMEIFNVSLNALRNGMPELGLRKPPNAEIAAGLEDIAKEWQITASSLQSLIDGDEGSVEAQEQAFHELNAIMAKMNKVVVMYAEAADNQT